MYKCVNVFFLIVYNKSNINLIKESKMMNFISVNIFVPASNIAQHKYYLNTYGEDHNFPDECWTVYEPSNMDGNPEEVINYLLSGVGLGWIETEFAVIIVDCAGMPVARLKKAGAILGQADSTDQVLVNQIAEIYAQLSNESMLSA